MNIKFTTTQQNFKHVLL